MWKDWTTCWLSATIAVITLALTVLRLFNACIRKISARRWGSCEHKYQKEGGPTLKQCFDLIRSVSSAPVLDLRHLLDAVKFNWLIGNNDAIGRTSRCSTPASRQGRAEARMAPLYDIVCTAAYRELSREMAMRIGGQYSSERVTPMDFEKLAEDADSASRS